MNDSSKKEANLLPWAEPAEDRRRLGLANLLTFGLLSALFLSTLLVELPEPEREELEKVPPRLARMILEKEPPPPPPKIETPEPEIKPEPKPEPKPKPVSQPKPAPAKPKPAKPEPKPEPKPAPVVAAPKPKPKPKPTEEKIREARDKASKSGVLAMKKSLESLKSLASVKALRDQKLERSTASGTTRAERDLIETRAGEGSGGIELSQMEKPDRQTLTERKTTAVATPVDAAEAQAVADAKAGVRSREEIALVFDRNKDSFYALYRRAMRKNLGLAGDVVFELTVDPSGQVSAIAVRSSGLDDKALTRKLLARIRLFDFGARDVAPWQGRYTVTFSPAG